MPRGIFNYLLYSKYKLKKEKRKKKTVETINIYGRKEE